MTVANVWKFDYIFIAFHILKYEFCLWRHLVTLSNAMLEYSIWDGQIKKNILHVDTNQALISQKIQLIVGICLNLSRGSDWISNFNWTPSPHQKSRHGPILTSQTRDVHLHQTDVISTQNILKCIIESIPI